MKRAPSIALVLVLAGACVIAIWMWLRAGVNVAPEVVATDARDATTRATPASSALEADSTAAPARERDPTPAAARASEPAIEPGSAHSIDSVAVYGTISDAFTSERRIESAHVKFVRGSDVVIAQTDGQGRYSIDNLSPGEWTVSVDAAGYRRWSGEHALTDNLRLQQFDASLERMNVVWAQFRTPEGEDLATAARKQGLAWANFSIALVATHDAPSRRLAGAAMVRPSGPFQTTERRNGQTIRISSGFDRRYEFAEPLPMFLSACLADVVLDTRYVEEDGGDVTFVIALDQLRENMHDVRVRVLDANSGEPIASAQASLLYPSTTSIHMDAVDASGVVVFDHRPPGRWRLTIHAADYELVNDVVTVASDGDTELVYRLARGISIEGTIAGGTGGPISFSFELVPMTGLDATERSSRFAWSGTPDHFEIKPVGRALRVVRRVWGFDTQEGPSRLLSFKPFVADTRDGSKRGIVIQAVRVTKVALRADSQIADEVRIVDADQLPVAEDTIGSNGKLELRIVPGAYTAKLMKDGVLVDSIAFRVGTEAQTVDLRR